MPHVTATFVRVAPDCPVDAAEVPKAFASGPTVAGIQYELLSTQPYKWTLDELIFETYVRRQGLTKSEAKARKKEIWSELFSKSHPCMRASPLTKRYGWGVHHDDAGRMALYGVESPEYQRFASGVVDGVEVVVAMRSKREK